VGSNDEEHITHYQRGRKGFTCCKEEKGSQNNSGMVFSWPLALYSLRPCKGGGDVQEGMGFQRYGVDLANPDLVALAKSVGAVGHRLESADDLGATLHKCITTPAVHVLEVPVNYSVSDKLQVGATSSSALHEPLKGKAGNF
jgi:hypothetical protein